MSLHDEFSDNFLLMDFGRCFNIWSGWFELISISIRLLFGSLNGLWKSVFKFNVKLRKSTDVMLVVTVIGKNFLELINCHFLKHHKMSKIFNKKTVKLSYSCCRNMGSVIATIEELFNQLLITIDAIAETKPNVHSSIINV